MYEPSLRWAGEVLKNGKLLSLAAQQFDAFVTVDQNLPFQQNLDALPIAVFVMKARSIEVHALLPLVPRLLSGLESLEPRSLVWISAEQ